MQTTSTLYKTLLANPRTVREYKANIAGQEYSDNRIVDCSTGTKLFPGTSVGVGGCYSGQLDLIVYQYGEIPTMARIDLFARLRLDAQVSEWIPAGVYFIDTRLSDEGQLTIHGFDAMLKTEQVFLDEGDVGEWPRTAPAVVAEICRRIGVELDPRTVLDPSIPVGYPNDYTMRELLGYVAGAHAGNWIITPVGQLRLVTLNSQPPETNYLIDESGDAITFGGVRILV